MDGRYKTKNMLFTSKYRKNSIKKTQDFNHKNVLKSNNIDMYKGIVIYRYLKKIKVRKSVGGCPTRCPSNSWDAHI